jgi:hypothetical protein
VLHRTLVRLIFAFQAVNITTKTAHVALIAVPLLIQVYFNASLTYGLMRLFKVEYAIAAPAALIGASTFSSWPSPRRFHSSRGEALVTTPVAIVGALAAEVVRQVLLARKDVIVLGNLRTLDLQRSTIDAISVLSNPAARSVHDPWNPWLSRPRDLTRRLLRRASW